MTRYFREQVLEKRSYLKVEWCLEVVANPTMTASQADGRLRFWGYPAELDGRCLRVVTLSDGRTLHNAFPDRGQPRRT